MNKQFEKKRIMNIFLLFSMMILGAMFVYINLVQYKYGLNADVASEGLLAKTIWESKEWIPKEWYIGSEVRLISAANLAALIYGITKNICFSMGLGCVAAGVFLMGSWWYLSTEMELDTTQRLWMMVLALLLPNNKSLIELFYIYAAYYAFQTGLYFLTMALYSKLLKGKEIKKSFLLLVLLLHFILGMQGVRGLLMITVPLLAAEVLRRIYVFWCKRKFSATDHKITAFAVGLNLISYLGGRIPISVGHPLSRNIRKAPQKFLEIVVPDFLNTFDWNHISFSERIAFFIGMVLVLFLVAAIVFKGIKKQEIKVYEWVYLNLTVSVFLTVMALTFTTSESSSRYFSVIFFAMAMMLTILWKEKGRLIKCGIIVLSMVILVGNCNRFYIPAVTAEGYENDIYVQIGEYILQEGYHQAYAKFDSANTITVAVDGRIQVAAVASFDKMGYVNV